MKVEIKQFNVAMELKNSGIELEVKDTQGNHRGDLIVNKTSLIWCEGRQRRENGSKISWDDFIQYMIRKS